MSAFRESRAFQALVSAAHDLQMALVNETLRGRVVEIVLNEEAGLAVGLAPGQLMIVSTPAGQVDVRAQGHSGAAGKSFIVAQRQALNLPRKP